MDNWHPIAVARRKIKAFGLARYCPVCRSRVRFFLPHGLKPRVGAECPVCSGLERHRLVWMVLNRRTDLFDARLKKMLHIAPETVYSRQLRRLNHLFYVSADLRLPSAMIRLDVTRLPFPGRTFDAVYCGHVLEHVPEDRKALKELFRVMAPGGWALIQVPITAAETMEDPAVVEPAERTAAYGHPDHVRRYGPDVQARLTAAGFSVRQIRAADVVTLREAEKMGIKDHKGVFLCKKA